MHGDYGPGQQRVFAGAGSSPYAWGLPADCERQSGKRRFIPICMGITIWLDKAGYVVAVHPHMHGDYSEPGAYHEGRQGSSPYAWGLQRPAIVSRGSDRFIPICMGITQCHVYSARLARVHPHMHGDYVVIPVEFFEEVGSSPYAWGLHNVHFGELIPQGFIPICMGITLR